MAHPKFKFDFKASGFSKDALTKSVNEIRDYLEHMQVVVKKGGYSADESSVNLVKDESQLAAVGELVDQLVSDKLKYIVVIGIGGSNLGTQAVYEGLRGQEFNSIPGVFPKLLFMDTVSPLRISNLLKIIDAEIGDPEEIVVNAISKSGGTSETIANLQIIFDALKAKFGPEVQNRFVFTTDKGSRFWKMAEDKGIAALELPKMVGGRYSVFSAVGLFPLMLGGVYVEELIEGAANMLDESLNLDLESNFALISAALTFQHWKQGIAINNSFFFNPELNSLGSWYRQLMGESVGKQFDLKGNEVHAGITPIVSIGSTDLHSMAQLYFGGPRDKFVSIVYTSNQDPGPKLGSEFASLVDGISEKTPGAIMQAIVGGVIATYKNNKLPFIEIDLGKITPYSIGQYMQFKMVEMMYLARLMDVNAFDQRNVEEYKEETRKLL